MTSLWQTAPDRDSQLQKIRRIEEMTTACSFEDAAYWLARFLHHFPTKNAERDAVIIGDLASDISKGGGSVVAVVVVLDELRLEATAQNPWLPPSGVIIGRILRKSDAFKNVLISEKKKVAPEIKKIGDSHGL
jgi:hypothetical protein